MMDILHDVAAASTQSFVVLSFVICAVIIILQFSINSRLRTQLHDVRELTAIADAAMQYAVYNTGSREDSWKFLWCFRFSPHELETRFPSWPAFRNRHVKKVMRAHS